MRLTRSPARTRPGRKPGRHYSDRRPRRGPVTRPLAPPFTPPFTTPFTPAHRARHLRSRTSRPTTGRTTTPPTSSFLTSPSVRRRTAVWRRLVAGIELAVLALVLTTSASATDAHAADTLADTMVVAIADSVTTVLNNIRDWIMGILAGLATVFLTIGGVRYVLGSGDPSEIEKAKTAFKSAGWGFGLAALAPLVVEILKGIVGA